MKLLNRITIGAAVSSMLLVNLVFIGIVLQGKVTIFENINWILYSELLISSFTTLYFIKMIIKGEKLNG